MYPLFLGPGLLRTILFIVVFYYVGKFLFRWWIKSKLKEHADKMNASVNEQQAAHMRHEKGKVHIRSQKSGDQKSNSSEAGEFVDYEEVN